MTDQVFKKIHEDGSETVIKQVKSAFRDEDGNYTEREEVVTSIFISSSVGCHYKCTFCHLTEMGMAPKRLRDDQVVSNVIEAVAECEFVTPETDIKLCFMGMGDPCLDPENTRDIIVQLIKKLIRIKEVDISTVNPRMLYWFSELFPVVKIRLFYSLHSAFQNNRNLIMPQTGELYTHIGLLQAWEGELYIHYTPVEGLNDTLLDAIAIANFAKEVDAKQIRMLEFNPYSKSVYERPSEQQLSKIYKLFKKNNVDVKWQVSKGKEELAACGMFQDNEGN